MIPIQRHKTHLSRIVWKFLVWFGVLHPGGLNPRKRGTSDAGHFASRPGYSVRAFGCERPAAWGARSGLALVFMTLLGGAMGSRAADDLSMGTAGLTEPIHDVRLSCPVAGLVGSRPLAEGAFVNQGDVILELDKKLEELEVTRRGLIAATAKLDYERTEQLLKSTKSVSLEEVDKKKLDFRVAAVEHELAQEQMRRRQITAPFAGWITEYTQQVGEATQAQQALVRLVDTRQCYFVCNLEARLAHELKLEQKLPLEIEAGEKPVRREGVIVYLAPVIDPASGLLKVKLLFENQDGKIRPGAAGRLVLPEKNAN
jgi:RND family efflux transporter MFP subunit